MRATWLPAVLEAAGLNVRLTQGWETRGVDALSPKLVIAHHTASSPKSTDAAVESLLIKGRSDVPGPLAQLGLQRDGTFVVIAAGVANHAGKGTWKGITGNSNSIGIEAYNSGLGEPWPEVQLDAYRRGCAAILKHLNLKADSLIAHREWAPGRKIDPTGIDMTDMRARVAQLIGGTLLTSIMGVAGVVQSQALTSVQQGANRLGGSVYDANTLSQVVAAYWSVGQVEGVRPDLALAQAAKETGWFTYRKPDGSSSIVSPDQHNFAGIGVTGAAGVRGESWPTVTDGVRGHLRRLRMYAAGTQALHDLTILKRALPSNLWASAPYVEQLNGKWAYPGVGYGESIVNGYLKPMSLISVPVTDPPSDYASEAWEWAVATGIVRGSSPKDQWTAEQVVTAMFRARPV